MSQSKKVNTSFTLSLSLSFPSLSLSLSAGPKSGKKVQITPTMKVQLLLWWLKFAPNPLARDAGKSKRANVRREVKAILEENPEETVRDGFKVVKLQNSDPNNLSCILNHNGLTKGKGMLDLLHEHLATLGRTPTVQGGQGGV